MEKSNVFKTYPNCASSRLNLQNALETAFPSNKKKVNLVLNAYDEGIMDEIGKAIVLDSSVFEYWEKNLIDSYGISKENAEWTVDYWFSQYGVEICDKTYINSYKVQDGLANNVDNAISTRISHLTEERVLDISKLTNGEKIPKDMVETHLYVGTSAAISSISCIVRKSDERDDGTFMSFAGEYTGKSNKNLLILVMVYNAYNELIGYSGENTIDEGFNGCGAYSNYIFLPKDEYISKVVVRITLNPVYV